MGKYDELVEQARKLAGQIDPLSIDGPDSKLLRELATAITTLEAELEKLRPQVKVADDQWDAKCDELAAMKARGDRLAEALVMSIAGMMKASGRLEVIAVCNEDRRIVAALGGTCDFARQALTEWRDQ